MRQSLKAALIVLACGFLASGFAADKKPPIDVVVSTIHTQNIDSTIDSLGSLTAVNRVAVAAEVDGRLSNILFKNGQQVSKGMPIIQLDDSQAKANYQAALGTFNLSKRKYERAKLLLNQAISEQQLEQLKSQMESDKAAVKVAQTVLNQKQIEAPIDGILTSFQVHTGDYVTAGQNLVSIVDSSQLLVNYTVPQHLLPLLKMGQTVKITVSAYPHKVFYGTVNYISPAVNKSTRMLEVQALVPNKKNLLRAGMYVQVEQVTGTINKALVVSADAVQADIKGYYVYLVDNGHVNKTYITVGERLSNRMQVTKGLKLGDRVVISGVQKLTDGAAITVIKPHTARPAKHKAKSATATAGKSA